MCRFYAWHMDCPIMRKNGRCEFLHDGRVRETHDLMLVNMQKGVEIPICEYKEKLVGNYDSENIMH
jgi:hypothetical protein